ncbi:MAG TPA: hypothetical protein VF286_13300 [Acidiphilium sp.]
MSDFRAFRHIEAGWLDTAPRGLVRDRIWFAGPAIRDSAVTPYRSAPMAGYESLCLHDAVLIPEPFSVLDRDGVVQAGAPPSDPPSGPVAPDRTVAAGIAMEAGASVPLGRFLGHSLPVAARRHEMSGAAMQRDMPGTSLVGAQPTAPQAEALAASGFLNSYTAIATPARVAKLHLTRETGRGISRMIRPGIETLRFAAEPYEVSRRIAILVPAGRERFMRADRTKLPVWLRARGFAILDPDAMRIGDTRLGLFDMISVLAAAATIVIDDPVQAPLLGFCDPGATVIEIGIDGWPDRSIASCARLFSLEWRLVLGPAPHYPIDRGPPSGARQALRTETGLAALDAALTAADGAPPRDAPAF